MHLATAFFPHTSHFTSKSVSEAEEDLRKTREVSQAVQVVVRGGFIRVQTLHVHSLESEMGGEGGPTSLGGGGGSFWRAPSSESLSPEFSWTPTGLGAAFVARLLCPHIEQTEPPVELWKVQNVQVKGG